MSVRVRYGVACARDCFSGRRASRSSNVWCNVHLAWWVFKRCSLQKTYVYRILNNSVEHTTVTKKPSGWQKYDSPSYEKLPSGTHNTKKSLLTRGVRVDAGWSIGNSRASLARKGGSIPPPAICQEKQGVPALTTWVGGLIPQVGSSGRYSSSKRLLLSCLSVFGSKSKFSIFSLWCENQPKHLNKVFDRYRRYGM